mmetsp:Transcript_4608/g.6982  ORF Transcript_4608/g.6982 Transcript_4608/m.6982 type:complete len:235 (+) Transcript_4608:1105-1809(+)
MPNGIKTEWVHRLCTSVISGRFSYSTILNSIVFLSLKRPTGTEQVKSKRKHIVVNETCVDGKESHHGDHVTSSVHTCSHLSKLRLVVCLFVPKEVETSTEKESSVSNISIHDSEKKWESSSSEKSGVRLTIPGNTVSVDKLLVSISELIGGEVSRRSRPGLGNLVDKRRLSEVHVCVSTSNTHLCLIQVLSDNPSLSTEHTSNIRLEHVQGVVDCLLANSDPRPLLNVLGKNLA